MLIREEEKFHFVENRLSWDGDRECDVGIESLWNVSADSTENKILKKKCEIKKIMKRKATEKQNEKRKSNMRKID